MLNLIEKWLRLKGDTSNRQGNSLNNPTIKKSSNNKGPFQLSVPFVCKKVIVNLFVSKSILHREKNESQDFRLDKSVFEPLDVTKVKFIIQFLCFIWGRWNILLCIFFKMTGDESHFQFSPQNYVEKVFLLWRKEFSEFNKSNWNPNSP